MEPNTNEVLELMRSVQVKYFPTLSNVTFYLKEDKTIDGVAGRIMFGVSPKITVYYSSARVLEPRFRMGLVPVVSHELAHLIDPVDPDRILEERLPLAMVILWQELKESGAVACSMDA